MESDTPSVALKPTIFGQAMWLVIFILASSGMLLLNKLLATGVPDRNSLLLLQAVMTVIINFLGAANGIFKPLRPFTREMVLRMALPALSFYAMLLTSLFGLPHVSISTVLMTRSLSICILAGLEFVLFNRNQSRVQQRALAIIFTGALIFGASVPEFNVEASFWMAINAALNITTQLLEKRMIGNTYDQTSEGISIIQNMFIIPISGILIVVTGEQPLSTFMQISTALRFGVLASGVVGFCINLSCINMNKRFSATAVAIAATLSRLLGNLVSPFLFGDQQTVMQLVGVVTSIVGAGIYGKVPVRKALAVGLTCLSLGLLLSNSGDGAVVTSNDRTLQISTLSSASMSESQQLEYVCDWLQSCSSVHSKLFCLGLVPGVSCIWDLPIHHGGTHQEKVDNNSDILNAALALMAKRRGVPVSEAGHVVAWASTKAQLASRSAELAGNMKENCMEKYLGEKGLDLVVWSAERLASDAGRFEWSVVQRQCRPSLVAVMYDLVESERAAPKAFQEQLGMGEDWHYMNPIKTGFRGSSKLDTFMVFAHKSRFLSRQKYDLVAHLTPERYLPYMYSPQARGPSSGRQIRNFDMLTIMRTPTCVNYFTVMNAVTYLKPKGLRRLFVAVPSQYVESVGSWHGDVIALDENLAVPGVSKKGIERTLHKYNWTNSYGEGRTSAGWYLMQFLNLGFGLREDVEDVVVLHDADQIILPDFEVFAEDTFTTPSGESMPKINVKVGGLGMHHYYNYAYHCLTGQTLLEPPQGSYVAHTWTSYRPFLKELLEAFGHESVRFNRNPTKVVAEVEVAPWLENIIQCLNPETPGMGFGESPSYISHVLEKHPAAHHVMKEKTWVRNPSIELRRTQPGGYCCPTKAMFDVHTSRKHEFVGLELGHDSNALCGYSGSDYFFRNPYPPADHAFWRERNVNFKVRAPEGSNQETRGPTDRLFPWIDQARWDISLEESKRIVREMEAVPDPSPPARYLVHTEFNPDTNEDDLCFKNRLVVLSTLATNPTAVLKLWFYEPHWTPKNQACFGDLQGLPAGEARLSMALYQPLEELANIGAFSQSERQVYADTSMGRGVTGRLPNYSNLRRYLLLYNYGGMWLDTDVVIFRSLLPLVGLDFCYECNDRERYVSWLPLKSPNIRRTSIPNGAVVGTSAKQSRFMMLCMRYVLSDIFQGHSKEFWKWGPRTLKSVQSLELSANRASPYVSLPCMWFDPQWAEKGPQRLPGTDIQWTQMWSRNVTAAEVQGAMTADGFFAFHFHGGGDWQQRVSKMSPSWELTRKFESLLELQRAVPGHGQTAA